MRVLGIETSCDETGIAVYDGDRGLVAQAVYSQVALHARYGGVVPELASRDHIRKLLPLIRQVLAEAGLARPIGDEAGRAGAAQDGPSLGASLHLRAAIDGVAYTAGPGLVGALLVGAGFGRALAWSLGVPAIGVHHMEGHLLAPMLEEPAPAFPFVALLVSGGHTQLVHVTGVGAYRLLGDSVDDAAGEAFDKTAKILNLPYPGGPALAELAQRGDPDRYRFPRPMTDRPGLDFSFSGLKTYTLNALREQLAARDDPDQTRADIARAFEEAVVETLLIKCRRAVRQVGVKTLVMAGGVSANRRLRERIDAMMQGEGGRAYYPRPALCTDNGAMIAFAGFQRLRAGQTEPLRFSARPRWPLEGLPPIAGGLREPG